MQPFLIKRVNDFRKKKKNKVRKKIDSKGLNIKEEEKIKFIKNYEEEKTKKK